MQPKTFILLFTYLISIQFLYSQTSKYDLVYAETHKALRSSDPKKALANTDVLYEIAKDNAERIKSFSLKAHILYQYGLHEETIATLKKVDSLAAIDKNYSVQARVYGFLSTVYRENEIYNLGKNYLKKAVATSRKIQDKNEMYRFQGNLSQELAYYELFDSNNYSKAIAHLKKGLQLFDKVDSDLDKNFHKAVNDELIAKNYLYLNKIDSAFIYYQTAQKELENSELSDDPLKGYIYNGFANVYASRGDSKQALLNFKKAEEVAETSNFHGLKQEVYTSLMEFYKETDTKKYIAYNEKNLQLSKTEKSNRKIIADDIIKSLRKKQFEDESQYEKNKYFIIAVCLLAILLTILIYFYGRKQDYKKIRKFIASNESAAENEIEPIIKKDTTKEYISEATEKNILQSIKQFEKSLSYLDKTLSLNAMAAELNINHRYLSYVINKNTSKDFAGYINELRIKYIVDKLKNDDNYLKYKISYLADQAGFASHSRFTITFKKITGVSPLTFISYLQKENEEKKAS